MPITAKQLEQRRKVLGASDIPKILGVDPFGTAHDVYLEKIGQGKPFPGNIHTMLGNYLEPGLLKMTADRLGHKIKMNQRRKKGLFAASHDALVVDLPLGYEAKTTRMADNWGEEGTDEVPEHVLIQAHAQMMCGGLDAVYVPALVLGQYRLYRIDRYPDLVDYIEEEGTRFWKDHVKKQVPPDVPPGKGIMLELQRQAGKVAPVDEQAYEAWLRLKEQKKQVEELLEQTQSMLVEQLGDAEIGECSKGLLTYKKQSRRNFDSKRLRMEKPEVAEEYESVSEFYVMRPAKAK